MADLPASEKRPAPVNPASGSSAPRGQAQHAGEENGSRSRNHRPRRRRRPGGRNPEGRSEEASVNEGRSSEGRGSEARGSEGRSSEGRASEGRQSGSRENHPGQSTRQSGHLPPRGPRKPRTEEDQAGEPALSTRPARAEAVREKPKKARKVETYEDLKRETAQLEKEIYLEIATIRDITLD